MYPNNNIRHNWWKMALALPMYCSVKYLHYYKSTIIIVLYSYSYYIYTIYLYHRSLCNIMAHICHYIWDIMAHHTIVKIGGSFHWCAVFQSESSSGLVTLLSLILPGRRRTPAEQGVYCRGQVSLIGRKEGLGATRRKRREGGGTIGPYTGSLPRYPKNSLHGNTGTQGLGEGRCRWRVSISFH